MAASQAAAKKVVVTQAAATKVVVTQAAAKVAVTQVAEAASASPHSRAYRRASLW